MGHVFEQDHEQFIGQALSTNEVGVWSWEGSTDRVRYCPFTAKVFGVPVMGGVDDALPIARFADAVYPPDRKRFAAALDQARRIGSFAAEYRTQPRRGVLRRVVDQGRYLFDEDGRPVAGRGVIVDVTDEDRDGLSASVLASAIRRLRPVEQAAEHALALSALLEDGAIAGRGEETARVAVRALLHVLGTELSASASAALLSDGAGHRFKH